MDFNPDAFIAQQQPTAAAANTPPPQQAGSEPTEGFDPDEFLHNAQQEKYGTPGEMLKTAGEGLLQGALGPGGPLLEKSLGVKPEAILNRQEANPWTHGIAEGTSLVGTSLAGVGEGALLGKVGEAAQAVTGLTKGAQEVSTGFKVGSAAVQQAAEMAVLSGSDDVSKMILQDPDTSAQSALANAGIAAVLGGAGGAFMAGVASPLWHATVGPKAEEFLQTLANHANGRPSVDVMPAVQDGLNKLGIEVGPEMQAALSSNPHTQEAANALLRNENHAFTDMVNKLHEDMGESVAQSIGVPLEDVAEYSTNSAGHDAHETFKNELAAKYEPLADKYERIDKEDAMISTTDESRMKLRDQIIERGIQDVKTDSPYFKNFTDYAERVLARDSIGDLTQLQQEITKRARTMGVDYNEKDALYTISGMINDFKEGQITKSGMDLEQSGIHGASRDAAAAIAERQGVRGEYKEFAQTMNELTNHLGVGDFKGEGTLRAKIANKLSSEDLLKKFSPKGNADFIPFLQKHFPQTAEVIQRNEAQSYLSKAVKMVDGKPTLDYKQLSRTIDNAMKKEPELVKYALGDDALAKIRAAKTVSDSIPNPRNSGTPKGLMQLLSGVPTSALAMVGWMTGHNPLIAGLIGHAGEHFGPSFMDSGRIGLLRFMAADQPVNAAGYRAMTEFLNNTYKGQNLINKAVGNVLQRGAQVLTTSQLPVKADREKLDKQVTKLQANPDTMMHKDIGGDLGSYLPTHQAMLMKNATNIQQYLQHIKPQPHTFGPLDKPVPPQPSEIARYNRALDVAIQPAIVMQHIKDGTLQSSDILDLHQMYPGLYQTMASKLTTAINGHHADGEPIPYHTRLAASLFLGAPMDSSMQPQNIMAAQPMPKQPPQQQGAGKPKPSKVNEKQAKSYMTTSQAAESDRGDRT